MVQDGSYSFDGITLLASLSPLERAELLRKCVLKRYATGEHIIDGQSDSRDVYFVVEGTVRVVNYSLSGREVALDDIPAGNFFGELSALDGAPRSAFVIAQGAPAVTAAMPPEVFLDLLSKHPPVSMEIMRRLTCMIRQANDRIMDLSVLGANNRVHAELLRQCWQFTRDGHSAEIKPIPVHSDIASRVSTTRETVARVMGDLAKEGIVERRKDVLAVLDMHKLALMVEEVRGN